MTLEELEMKIANYGYVTQEDVYTVGTLIREGKADDELFGEYVHRCDSIWDKYYLINSFYERLAKERANKN